MREILFRGRRKDKGKWVYGDYLSPTTLISDTLISCEEVLNEHGDIGDVCYKVIPETVGQYTGLTDKNGNKIFEGDILEAHLDEYYPDNSTTVSVIWRENGWCILYNGCDSEPLEKSDARVFCVVGNIHDNPELLEDER